ncbi:WzyE family oligosaccharide polymerase [Shigella flexneri]
MSSIATFSPPKLPRRALTFLFYFFIPRCWWSSSCVRQIAKPCCSSVSTVAFGILTYMIVGGTARHTPSYCLRDFPVYRHHSWLDSLTVDAGGGRGLWHCGECVAGAEA